MTKSSVFVPAPRRDLRNFERVWNSNGILSNWKKKPTNYFILHCFNLFCNLGWSNWESHMSKIKFFDKKFNFKKWNFLDFWTCFLVCQCDFEIRKFQLLNRVINNVNTGCWEKRWLYSWHSDTKRRSRTIKTLHIVMEAEYTFRRH